MLGFKESRGPVTTGRSIHEIAQIIEREGDAKSFLSLTQRLGLLLNGTAQFGSFAPTGNDDPFQTRRPDFTVGYAWSVGSVADLGPRSFGWQVIFDVVEQGSTRGVIAKATGNEYKRQALKFADLVLRQL